MGAVRGHQKVAGEQTDEDASHEIDYSDTLALLLAITSLPAT